MSLLTMNAPLSRDLPAYIRVRRKAATLDDKCALEKGHSFMSGVQGRFWCAGAKAWMVKPFSGAQLLNAVAKLSA